jgi:hypothetical protein
MLIKQHPEADITKGKMVVDAHQGFQRKAVQVVRSQSVKLKWILPDHGEAKLNTDGAFDKEGAGIGMILRDENGDVIISACRHLQHCIDATEAELTAIEEGLRLALHWFQGRFVVETDSAEAVHLIKQSTPNTSAYAFQISAIRELLRE